MCIISNKLKFCTCVDKDIKVEELNHYWMLSRYKKHKNLLIVGQVSLPYSSVKIDFHENLPILRMALKAQNTFDNKHDFKEKDILNVVLNNKSVNLEEILSYEFEYKSGNWIHRTNKSSFHLLNHYDQAGSGEIKEIV